MSNANDFIIKNGVLKEYVGSGGDVVIPEGVTRIGGNTFKGCTNLTSIVIPKGVTRIGNYAFCGCTNLTNITIPEGVSCVGKCALFGCNKLENVNIPVSLGAHLNEFLDTNDALRIHIADLSVLSAKFRKYAALCFAKDSGLPEDPRFENHSKYLKANAGKLVNEAMIEPALLSLLCREKWIKAKDADAFLAAVQQTGNAEAIALMLNYQSITLTRQEKEKERLRKEKEENTIFDRAIARMNQQGITGLNFVVDGFLFSFYDKNELKKHIEKNGGKLQTTISAKTDYFITNEPQSNTEKQKKAAELGIEVITERQFNDKANRSFAIEDGRLIRYLGAGGEVVIPEGVTRINNYVFEKYTNLTNITIPEGVTRIGSGAFKDCTNLTSIVIPESVTVIGDWTFDGCNQLTIHAPAGSYAENYAKENNIPFVAE